ncbi:MAG: ATP-binding protein [bacterium]|nr:ATP-binding protein [bacterium]
MTTKETMFNKIKRDNNCRTAVVIISFLLCLILWYIRIIPNLNPILVIALIATISTIVIYVLLYNNIASSYMDYGVATCDFILITTLIYYTGGIESPFYLIYIIVILIEVMDLVDKKHMIYNIIVSLFAYAFVIIMMNYNNLSNLLIYHLIAREIFILVTGIIALQYANMINTKQEEIIRANKEKVEVVQELAIGVLHEIRNPLAGIKLLVQGLNNELGNDDCQKDYLNEISMEVDKLNKFSTDFLNYARPFNLNVEEINLESLTNEILHTLIFTESFANTINIHKKIPSDLMIIGDREKIREVLFNIINNAIQSIEEREKTIEEERKIIIKTKSINLNYIGIEISDTGIGISHENLDKIFKPFFTLKEKGTGLGLSICKRIIDAHEGSIEIKSQLNMGTTFLIHLPVKI